MSRERLGPPKPMGSLTSNDATPWHRNGEAQGNRITFIATGVTVAFDALIEVSPNKSDVTSYYVPINFTAEGNQTVWIGEPNSFIRVVLENHTDGSLDSLIQEYK